MEVETTECMFCHAPLTDDPSYPENLAFLGHLGDSPGCQAEFRVWTRNMHEDFGGD